MKKLFGNNRHIQLRDDADDSVGADSNRALLQHSKKTALRAVLSHIGMICALVSSSPAPACIMVRVRVRWRG